MGIALCLTKVDLLQRAATNLGDVPPNIYEF